MRWKAVKSAQKPQPPKAKDPEAAKRNKGLTLKRVLTVITIDLFVFFCLMVLHQSVISHALPFELEIRSAFVLDVLDALPYAVWTLCCLAALMRVTIARKGRWYRWVFFGLSTAVCLFLVGMIVLLYIDAADYLFDNEPRRDVEVLYRHARNPARKVIRQSNDRLIFAWDIGLFVRATQRFKEHDLNGEWEVYKNGEHLSTTVFENGREVSKIPGADWQPSSAAIVGFSASSTLPDSRSAQRSSRIIYSADKAFDGDPATAWVEGTSGNGHGLSLSIEFDKPINADAVEIMPGYFDESRHAEYNRVEKLTVHIGDQGYEVLSFTDEMKPQMKTLEGLKTFDRIRFEISETYRGSQGDDTCIAEIAFYEMGRKVELTFKPGVSFRNQRYYLPDFASLEFEYQVPLSVGRYVARYELKPGKTLSGWIDAGSHRWELRSGNWYFDAGTAQFYLRYTFEPSYRTGSSSVVSDSQMFQFVSPFTVHIPGSDRAAEILLK